MALAVAACASAAAPIRAVADPGPAGAPATERLESCGPVRAGGPAPAFGGWTFDGQVISSKRLLAGTPDRPVRGVVLSFFATWCEPCKAGLRVLAGVAPELEARGVRVLLVSVGQGPAEARPFLAGLGVRLPGVEDRFGKVSERFGVSGGDGGALPRTFILDAGGKVLAILGREGADYGQVLRAVAP